MGVVLEGGLVDTSMQDAEITRRKILLEPQKQCGYCWMRDMTLVWAREDICESQILHTESRRGVVN